MRARNGRVMGCERRLGDLRDLERWTLSGWRMGTHGIGVTRRTGDGVQIAVDRRGRRFMSQRVPLSKGFSFGYICEPSQVHRKPQGRMDCRSSE